MLTAQCHLVTGSIVSLIQSSIIPTNWPYRIKQDRLPEQCAATKQPLLLDGSMLLNLRTGSLTTCVRIGIAPQLAIAIVLGTALTDHLLRGNFALELSVVTWLSRPVANTARPKTPNTAHRTSLIADKPVSAANYNKTKTAFAFDGVRAAEQIKTQPHTQHHVLANTH